MEKVHAYYKGNIETNRLQLNKLKRRIHLMGSIRLLLAAGALLSLWFLRDTHWMVLTGITLLFAIPFSILMVYHNRLFAQKQYTERLISLNENELNGLDYNFSAFDGAPDKISPDHMFSLDLDLFGDQSLFQSINRTITFFGRELLVQWFTQPLSDKKEILERQKGIEELSLNPQLRQHFYVTGAVQRGTPNDLNLLTASAHEKTFFLNKSLWKILIWLIPAVWIIIIAGCSLGFVNWTVAGIYFPICFLISYARNSQITRLHNSVNKMEKTLSVYSNLIRCIEYQNFQSTELKHITNQLTSKTGKYASRVIKKLSDYIGMLDQRFSLVGILLNIFYLRDTRTAISLEEWRQIHAEDFSRWIDSLAHFDAYSSLSGFAFNHPDYIYPEIADSYFQMKGEALGHPLLNRETCVKNPILIPENPWFLIITGANMAGKSTYLRTIGVNFLLSGIGAPVCAASLTVYPARLITSLRTSDSLSKNESYFFAELSRLKKIIDKLQQGEKLFIILDEILKGTNSIDKQKGSLALIKQLTSYKTCGIIATHDLVLGTLEQEFPGQIKNYCFEADIKEDELSFPYQLREGIAQNMNACFLMNKMGITVDASHS